jgi:uncharacterized protein
VSSTNGDLRNWPAAAASKSPEDLALAKKQGKVRFVGFTGRKDPSVHMGMLKTNFPFDAVQMPLNPFDATFEFSFERLVLPELNRRGSPSSA